MKNLATLLNTLESHIEQHAVINPAISQASVGWHLEHSLLVLRRITGTLEKSNPADYRWKWNATRVYVMTAGKFPRGKGKAPEATQPKDTLDAQTLQTHLAKVRERLQVLDTLHENQFFLHPYFGDLNLRPARKFLAIHTAHHLAIVRDILQS